MAEFVQQSIEESLPQLEQLERVGLFSKPEIKSIIKKRRSHEYRLVRRRKEKDDFLKYIQYEIHLLALIKIRREKLRYFFKKDEIEFAIVLRVTRLFKRTCTLFPEALKVWLFYAEFLKKWNKKSMLSKMMAKMLKVHGNNPGLWIMAAKFQMEDNFSSENARSLLLRALRHHPTSTKMWQEYFRMELMHADKLRKRWAVLKQGDMRQHKDTEMSDVVMEGQAAKVIYQKALLAIPNDVKFHLSFITVMQQFDFTDKMQDDIYTDIQAMHPRSELTWDAVARRHITKKYLAADDATMLLLDQEEQCFRVFEEASSRLNTDKMWCMYATACLERTDLETSTAELSNKRVERTLSVLTKACDSSELTPVIYTTWVRLLLKLGMLDEALATVHKSTDVFHDSAVLWKQRLTLNIATIETGDTSANTQLRRLFDQSFNQVKKEGALSLWELGLQWYQDNDVENIETLLQRGLTEAACVSLPFKEHYLDWAATQGLAKMRTVYKKLAASKPLSVGFYKKYMSIEAAQVAPKMTRIRAAYEDALSEYGSTSPELWLAYIQCEMQHPLGKVEMVSQLHWKAMKVLDGDYTEEFVSAYTLMQAGHS